jgi:hypothetical protein
MMYRLTIHGRRDVKCPRFAIFPVRDVNLIEIENEFDYKAPYVFVQIPNRSLEKHSRHL